MAAAHHSPSSGDSDNDWAALSMDTDSNMSTPEMAFEDFVDWGDEDLSSDSASLDGDPTGSATSALGIHLAYTPSAIVYGKAEFSDPDLSMIADSGVHAGSYLPFYDEQSHLRPPSHVDPTEIYRDGSHPYKHMRSLKISGKKLKGTAAGRAEHRGLSPVLDSEDITVLALPEIRSLATVRAQSIIDAECMHILATNTFPDSTEYLRLRLGVPDWRPLDLSVIPDSEYRPAGLWAVIALAIQGSRFKMLPLRGIISAISAHLKFYRDDPSDSWKETLRHTLSLYTCFKLVKRPFGGGMGGYWRVEFTAGKSTRPRKRKQKGVVVKQNHHSTEGSSSPGSALKLEPQSPSPASLALEPEGPASGPVRTKRKSRSTAAKDKRASKALENTKAERVGTRSSLRLALNKAKLET